MNESVISYEFRFADGRIWCHGVMPSGIGSNTAGNEEHTAWTRLGFETCANCPLPQRESSHCPMALALVEPMKGLVHTTSHDEVEVRVKWRGRDIRQRTTLQRGLGSLLGSISASCGCPHTRILRPMAWFHWPFCTSAETLYRSLGTYLLGQYLRQMRGLSADFSLGVLRETYQNLRQVNLGMANRLRAAVQEDSSVNGLVLLDLLAADTLYSLENYEGELDAYFKDFLEQD
ncbi:DUF6901 family protein [Pseudomonas sp. TCU-HL1]|uniref:DUF6901 family protein n=1 Tax=Pseudomonas sp. TCU-HL1 TaxID=1856685 RepID=UPI00083CC37F|nr:hypothetical protein THL1_580 [Pseudomonas sp. TCU-HL1]